MIVKTPGSQMGSPAAAEEGGEEVGGGRWESGNKQTNKETKKKRFTKPFNLNPRKKERKNFSGLLNQT